MSAPTKPPPRRDGPRLAIVLSGGGARGAYEAGVLKYIREDLAGDLGGHVRFDIICGTSVGAIHACFLAATADEPGQQGRRMCESWESLVLEELVSFGVKDFLRLPRVLLGKAPAEQWAEGEMRMGGIVQTRNLEKLVRHMMPWNGIGVNREAGRFESLSVSATDIGSGKTVVFIESGREIPPWSTDPHVRAKAVRIRPRHCIASAAIPLIFPSVQVGQRFYCDGGLRQNTPLSPALRLGADKVLVISLKSEAERTSEVDENAGAPGAVFLAGKLLDAFLLDHMDYDLKRLRRLNGLIEAIHSLKHNEFAEQVDALVRKARGLPYRAIGEMVLSPSVDLGDIAGDVAKHGRFKGTGGGPGIRMLRRLAASAPTTQADLLSYLLFDGYFSAELVRIGYEDARARHEELCRFLQDFVEPAA